jgi:hypothetical protein
MNINCGYIGCPDIIDSSCVFYEGQSLIYTGINTNDTIQTSLQKIDAKIQSILANSTLQGSGTINKLAKWAAATNLTNSNITDDGTTISINSSIVNIIGSTELKLSTNALYVKTTKDFLLLVPTSQINPAFGLNQNFRIGFGGDSTKFRNTVLGRFVLGDFNNINSNTGDSNTAIGYQVLGANTSGTSNAAFGAQSLRLNTTGNSNMGYGPQALYSNTTGSWNVGIGPQALFLNETGSYNVAIGFMAGFNDFPLRGWKNTNNNVFIGYNSGNTGGTGSIGYNTFIGSNTGSGIETGAYNTIIGAQVSGLSASLSNNVIIADGQGNIRIQAYSSGNIGVGATSDTGYKLDLNGNIRVRQVSEYASNATALAAGLVAGAFYRTGEFLKVVY